MKDAATVLFAPFRRRAPSSRTQEAFHRGIHRQRARGEKQENSRVKQHTGCGLQA